MIKIDEACGEGREFIVTLKYSVRDKAFGKVFEKCRLAPNLSSMLMKGKYLDKEISIFKTGKLVIREFKGRKEATDFLEELFK